MITSYTIYQKYFAYVRYSTHLLRKYPKFETFSLVKDIRTEIYDNYKRIYCCLSTKDKQYILKTLRQIDISLNFLKLLIRLSYKEEYISLNNYEAWSKSTDELCRIIGAWIKNAKKK